MAQNDYTDDLSKNQLTQSQRFRSYDNHKSIPIDLRSSNSKVKSNITIIKMHKSGSIESSSLES